MALPTSTKTAETLGVAEAARQLGYSLAYTYGLVWSGKLSARKEGNNWCVDARAVEARLKQKEKRSA